MQSCVYKVPFMKPFHFFSYWFLAIFFFQFHYFLDKDAMTIFFFKKRHFTNPVKKQTYCKVRIPSSNACVNVRKWFVQKSWIREYPAGNYIFRANNGYTFIVLKSVLISLKVKILIVQNSYFISDLPGQKIFSVQSRKNFYTFLAKMHLLSLLLSLFTINCSLKYIYII